MINVVSTRALITRSLRLALFICLIGLLAARAYASTPTDGETPLGLQPGAPAGSYALSDLDHINLYNGNLNFTLPLMHIGGRGGAQMTMNLTPLELKWRVLEIYIPEIPPNPAYYSYILLPPGVWNPIQPGYGPGVLLGRCAATDGDCGINFTPEIRYTLTRLTFIAPDGTEYELRDQSTQGKPADLGTAVCFGGGSNFGRGKVFVTADGTAMTFVSDTAIEDHITYGEVLYPTGYLFLRDGTRFRVEGGLIKSLTDRNGNVLNFTYDQYNRVSVITDSINRTVNVAYGDLANGGFDSITWKGSRGTPRTLKIWGGALSSNFRVGTAQGSSTYTQKTYHQLFPDIPNTGDYLFDTGVFSAVELPDGRRYRFFYNSYGELARCELPTGGAYEYDLQPTDGVLYSVNTGYNVYRRVIERRSYADGLTLENKTTYAKDASSGNTSVDVNQWDGSGNLLAHDKHYFSDSAEHSFDLKAVCYPSYLAGKEYLTETYDLGGNVVRKLEQNFAQRGVVPWWSTWTGPSGGGEPPNDTRLTDRTTTLADVSPNLVMTQTLKYDQFNNVKDTCDYDYGSGAAGTLLRHTHTTYLVTNPVNNTDYTTVDLTTPTNSIHLRNLQLTQIVNTGCGNNQTALAETDYEYDNYTSEGGTNPNHAALTPRSNISGHDAAFSDTLLTRGNATLVKRWIDSTTSASTYQQYDVAGNAIKSKDALGNGTLFDFSDRYGIADDEARNNVQAPPELRTPPLSTYCFPTSVTNALNQTAYTQYDYYLGRPINGEDLSGVVTKGLYNDPLDRPTEFVVAENLQSLRRRTLITYSDSTHLMITQSDQNSFQDGALKSETITDGLGRKIESHSYESTSAYITTRQEFDSMGRVRRSFNPYRATSDATYGSTVTTYDALGRIFRVETFDGVGTSTGAITTSDQGNASTVIDQAGKKRRSVTDALGRLIRVDEPDAGGNLDNTGNPPQPLQSTSYTYDALDNMVKVTQGGQSRYFGYDFLKRLIRVRTPEESINSNLSPTFTEPVTSNSQWCAKYVYDANSNLRTRVDARNITTTYDYDVLNRITSRTYPGDPQNTLAVSYKYDNQSLPIGFPPGFDRGFSTGRLVAVIYGGTSAGNYAGYDQVGRVISSYQQTDSQNYGFGYAYDLAGELTSETYPSGRQVRTEYDTAGRIAGIRAAGVYYAGAAASDTANRIQYAAQGAVSVMKLGSGKWEHTLFNSRFQPTQIGLGTSSTNSGTLELDFSYGTTSNNGNVLTQTITAPKTQGGNLVLTQNYAYDTLNRLSVAEEFISTASQWKQTYDCDRYANRAVRNTSYIPSPSLTPQSGSSTDFSAFNQSTNRIALSGFGYDDAGNLTRDPTTNANGIVYDAENRQTQYSKSGQATNYYYYDGEGHRVKKIDGGGTTVFVYDAGGRLIAEYRSDSSPPVGGGGTSYLTGDHLGSTRVVTASDGSVKARYDYLPFGEEIGSTVGSRGTVGGYGGVDSTKQKFTQNERDAESGLDYFLARYYSPAAGKFNSPDPKLDSGSPLQPQGWNRYSYVINNPQRYTDPTGLDWWFLPGQLPYQPVWFDKDPGGDWKRWTDKFNFVVQVTAGPNAGQWFALDPYSKHSYVSTTRAGAVAAFQSFVGGHFGLIHGTQAEKDFAAGFAEGVSPLGPVAGWLNRKFLGVDTTSRDYKGGFVIGILVAAGVNITADTVQSLRATALGATAGDAEMFGMLREAAKGKGNFGIGSATRQEADEIGLAWVGQGYKSTSGGNILISADGLRQYRLPAFKPNLGKIQANLEWRWPGVSQWQGNAHIHIR